MTVDWSRLGPQGLDFFGSMSASVSHEIKNVLAVVNENAGLLEDMLARAAQGGEVDPERLSQLTRRIQSNIGRGDTIVKRMNRFAHSVDQLQSDVGVAELCDLMVAMSHRLASQQQVRLAAQPGDYVTIHTWPYFLEHLFFLCLSFALEKAGKDSEVAVSTGKDEQGAWISINGVASPPDKSWLEAVDPLLQALQASVTHSHDTNSLIVRLPFKVQQV